MERQISIFYEIYLYSLIGHWAAVLYSFTTKENTPLLMFFKGVIEVYDQQGVVWDQS